MPTHTPVVVWFRSSSVCFAGSCIFCFGMLFWLILILILTLTLTGSYPCPGLNLDPGCFCFAGLVCVRMFCVVFCSLTLTAAVSSLAGLGSGVSVLRVLCLFDPSGV